MSRLRQVLSRVSGSNGASAIVHRRLRTVPAAVLEGSELIQLGGGESVPCPGIGSLPLAASARRSGLGSPSLALPPARVHVLRDVRIAPSSRVVASGELRDLRRRLATAEEERDILKSALGTSRS